jgi:ADP-ribose pyrophosphatase
MDKAFPEDLENQSTNSARQGEIEGRVQVLDSTTCHDGFLRLRRYRLRHQLFRGGMSGELVRERVERLRAVAVLPYDPVTDRVVLVQQFRVGAAEQGPGAWLLEIVGGVWDQGASAEEVARNEAREEADCEILDLLPIANVWASPGTSEERDMLFCGRVDASGAGGVHGLAHEGEDIQVVPMTFAAAVGAVESGRISAATALIALQWLQIHRERVRALWL